MTENERLDQLFRRYREACPDVEPSVGFMPAMWNAIEARRGWTYRLRTYTRGVVAAAATVCMAFVLFDMSSLADRPSIYNETYVEALNDELAAETLAFADIVAARNPILDLDSDLEEVIE